MSEYPPDPSALTPRADLQPRRLSKDRRRRPTPLFGRLLHKGRRKEIRRFDDHRSHHYVDRYGLNSLLIILTALLLCIADAFFTLQLVEQGAEEVNPLMAFFLGHGPTTFLATKYLLTGASLLVLLVHKHRPLLGGRLYVSHVLGLVPVIYSLLLLWQITLNLKLG